MGFPGQEYWSGLPFPSPGDLPNPGIEPKSPALAGSFFTTEALQEDYTCTVRMCKSRFYQDDKNKDDQNGVRTHLKRGQQRKETVAFLFFR